ncbi:hypothetical protein AB0D04_13775 [Streptomyces sp. NPDC048483]|uniref:hypothetical protein n=1 Tax=Streptomyces sp. NPDC048483 TaxID=3154927 RepID=UPI0034365085
MADARGLIEPPTAAQVETITRSALHQADERAVAEVAARLAREEDCPRRLDALVFADPTAGRRGYARTGTFAAPPLPCRSS